MPVADLLNERLGLGRWFDPVLLTHEIGEPLVGPQRSRTVAHAVSEHEQAPQERFVRRQKLDRLVEPVHRGDDVSFRFGGIGESGSRLPGTSLEAPRLALLPAIESGHLVDHQTAQEFSSVELQSLLERAVIKALLELDGVAPESRRIDTDEGVTLRQEHLLSEITPDRMERLTQGVARPILAVFGPEDSEEAVTPVHSARPRSGEVSEHRQAFGLKVYASFSRILRPDLGHAERAQLDHEARLSS